MASRPFVKSTKNLLIALLTLTTAGGALLAWRQYAELVELRAIALNRDERTDLQKRIWDLEKNNRELQDRLAAARLGGSDDVEKMLATVTEERPDDNRRGRGDGRGGRGGPPPQFNALRELMNKPDVQAMIAQQQKSALDARYASLFKNLNLSPEQTEKLKALLIERQASRQDVFEAARAQGIDPRENPEAYRKLMADARNQVESSIKSVLGDSGYAQLQNYEQTMPQRGLVNEIQQRLTYSNTPLTANQAEQLVQILATNTPPRPTTAGAPGTPGPADGGREGDRVFMRGPGGFEGGPPRGPDMGMLGAMFGGPGGGLAGAVIDGGRGPTSAPITDAAVNQAQGVLSQPQVAVLRQLQQQQQTQQQLSQMVRQTLSTAAPATTTRSSTPGTSTGGTTPAPAPTPRRRPGG